MKELLKALSKAKQEMRPIVKGETNPFFKSKYFDINSLLLQVEPILQSHGLILVQPIEDGNVFSKIYHVESGEMIGSSMTLPEVQDPQKMGSAVTYYRRYTLQSLLALQAEDDEGNEASVGSKQSKPDLHPRHSKWLEVIDKIKLHGTKIEQVKHHFSLTRENEELLLNEAKPDPIQNGTNYNQTDIKLKLKNER